MTVGESLVASRWSLVAWPTLPSADCLLLSVSRPLSLLCRRPDLEDLPGVLGDGDRREISKGGEIQGSSAIPGLRSEV